MDTQRGCDFRQLPRGFADSESTEGLVAFLELVETTFRNQCHLPTQEESLNLCCCVLKVDQWTSKQTMSNVCWFPCCAHRKAWIQVPAGGVSFPRIFIHTCCSRASLCVVADGSDEGDLGKKHQGGKLNIVNLLQGVFWGKILTAWEEIKSSSIRSYSEGYKG